MPISTQIKLDILRSNLTTFSATTTLAELKRDPATLVESLFRDHSFPMAVSAHQNRYRPPDSFTLQSGDDIRITIEGIGTVRNTVE